MLLTLYGILQTTVCFTTLYFLSNFDALAGAALYVVPTDLGDEVSTELGEKLRSLSSRFSCDTFSPDMCSKEGGCLNKSKQI